MGHQRVPHPGDRLRGAGDEPLLSLHHRARPQKEVGREALRQPPCPPGRPET